MRIFNMKDILRKRSNLALDGDQILEYEFGRNHMYCGWANKNLGLETSPLANPYTEKANARKGRIHVESRDKAVEMYRVWLWERICDQDQAVLDALRQVWPNTALVCWCAPSRCHCEVISSAAAWMHELVRERVKEAFVSERLIVWIRGDSTISVKLRSEVGPGGAYYTSVGWFGSCSYKQLIENLEFLEKGGSIIELHDPKRWGRIVDGRYATEVKPA